MTDGTGALGRAPDKESHFVVTRVEQSSQDDSVLDDGESATPSSVFSSGRADKGAAPSSVVFKIGDSPVFRSSATDSTGLSLPLHTSYPETSSAVTISLISNSEPSSAHMIHSHSSRFHIVTLDDNPFRRGRWLCKEKQVTDDPKPSTDLSVETARRKFTVHPVATVALTAPANGSTSVSSPSLVNASTPISNTGVRNDNSYQAAATSIMESVPEILSGGSAAGPVGRSIPDTAKSIASPIAVAPREPKLSSTSGVRSKPLLSLVNGDENAGQMLDSLLPAISSPIDTVVEQLSADHILREIGRAKRF
ncbi:hypothetical protein TTRE_0000362601 [Trichuris trichiura]|uniref:Uncharacterized protein n=1 Tax=Trichuris trichiura TaxID=36087 RepID=A0A077Z699_TRITR|nr:hypothetical protein TTRE_0000362601 [Trichuris trichiura]